MSEYDLILIIIKSANNNRRAKNSLKLFFHDHTGCLIKCSFFCISPVCCKQYTYVCICAHTLAIGCPLSHHQSPIAVLGRQNTEHFQAKKTTIFFLNTLYHIIANNLGSVILQHVLPLSIIIQNTRNSE